MLKVRSIGLALGITASLVALGIALGVIVTRVNQSAASTLTLSSSAVLSSADLAIWEDDRKTKPVTSLKFEGVLVQPPLRSLGMPKATVFIQNLSTSDDLYLIKPCQKVDTSSGTQVGTMDSIVFNLNKKKLGNTCDWPPTVKIIRGELVRADVRIGLDPNLASGDYNFQTVFQGINQSAMPGDVNGDGIPDFIVGAHLADPDGKNSAGNAYVYSGVDGVLLYQKTGDATGDRFGNSVSLIGDLNGDAREDFIVGAYLADPGGTADAGSAYVYSGTNGNLLYQNNGDGTGDEFGTSVSRAGDVNGDGKADFIVGAPLTDTGDMTDVGSAYVYSGVDGSLIYRKDGTNTGDEFGSAVSGAGDVNGDGRDDFIVGSPKADPAGTSNAGSAYVFSGADGTLLYQKTGDGGGDLFGDSVSGVGDANGDGKGDFIVGARLADPGGVSNAGSAYVYSGSDGSLLYQKTGDATLDLFGSAVSAAGDVNGDARGDFIVGAWGANVPLSDAGSAYVFSGADGSLLYQKTGDGVGDNFGLSVSTAGDVNRDGKADFIIGAQGDDPSAGLGDAGSAYVFSGADGSLLYRKDGAAGDRFGFSVGGNAP